ncbi:DNA polymerase III subunit chi [Lichenicoccus roseus]|uniref:DNA polymerase III subunit chi n=1 Tax=Lichenicoccus roseus TaxID=2683649 RepID=A0A5R9J7T5_9PROT|nr:DNA polymerase III subunit chi [Lichenicoccus roseus]TLU73642.1 DNA polymerase III subunit chi [Lichenicoccus roseus]
MAEIGFYHLTRSSAEQALPRLLGLTLEAGHRALVLCRDQARVQQIDEALWQAPEPSWLPHGTAKIGHAALQPIWIAPAPGADGVVEAPNKASYLFLLDGVAAGLDGFERAFDLFDGADEQSVAAARQRWSALKAAGHRLAYWRQDSKGWSRAG